MATESGHEYEAGPAGVRDRDCADPMGDPLPARDRSIFDPATESIVLAPILFKVGQRTVFVIVAARR